MSLLASVHGSFKHLTALWFKFNDVTGWHLVKGTVWSFWRCPHPLSSSRLDADVMQLFLLYTQYLPCIIYLGLNTNKGLQAF
jgi:hypothetical protein